jgi:hypothetical protein
VVSILRDSVDSVDSAESYSFRKYARSAARSSGSGMRSKSFPLVDATGGGGTPGGVTALMNLKSSM